MAYTVRNFKTKKALKKGVRLYFDAIKRKLIPDAVMCYNPGLGPDLSNFTGKVCLEGPHYPAAHTWYAEAELKYGVIIEVK